MPADPLDKQLVEAVLSRPRRGKAEMEEAKLAGLRPSRASAAAVAVDDDDDDDDDDDLDLGPEALADDADAAVGVVIEEDGAADPAAKLPVDAPAKLDAGRGRGAVGRGPRGDHRRHDRHRRPGPDVPQGDRQGRPADRRGGGRPGQGHRARGADGRGAVEGHRLAPRVDPPRHRAQDPHPEAAAPAALRARGARDGAGSHLRQGRQGPAGRDAGLPPHQGRARRPVRWHQGAPQGGEEAPPHLQRGADAGHLPAAPRLGVPRRPQRRPRLARQRRAAGDLGLDPRGRGLPGAPALGRGRPGRRPAQADGLRPRGAAPTPSCATARATSWSSAATPASS